MSLPNFATALKPPTSGYGATGTSCPYESGHSRRHHHQPPFFLSLDTAEVPTPHKRRIVPLPSPPASPDTPMTSSDSETFSPESPTIRCLDPAHRPSPRSIHALRSQHPPLTVINDDRNDGSSRLLPPPMAVGRSWSGRWSSGSAENFSALHNGGHDLNRGSQGVQQPFWPPRYTPWTNRGPLEVRPGESRLQYWYSGNPLKLTFAIIVVLVVSLCLTLVPSIMISRQMVEIKHSEDFFGAFRERPLVTVATWIVSSIVFIGFVVVVFIFGLAVQRRLQERRESYEEAVRFARETMPEYGTGAGSQANQSWRGYFHVNRSHPA